MKIVSTFAVICLLISCPLTWAAQQPQPDQDPVMKVFRLTDGTTLKGSIAKIEDGKYLVDTTKLGEVLIAPEEIVSMMAESVSAPNTQAASYQRPATNTISSKSGLSGQMQQAQQIMTSDPAIMNSIQELMKDPEIMQLLQDPSLMKSLMTMDPQEMQSNPKVQKLLQNPVMQQIIQRAKQQMEQQSTQ